MKHFVIKNLGPVTEADMELRKINVIVGPQSSGKSCILKTASYCTWVEKRIELKQSAEDFENGDDFIKPLVTFHKLYGYLKSDTYIEYESDFMHFSYDNSNKEFKFNWKDARWKYRRPKVTYIPAERNIVAAIPNWFDVKMSDDSLRSFMSDWEMARKEMEGEVDILNLGVKYHYDPISNTDKIIDKDVELELTNASSGVQALIPLYVYLNFLRKFSYKQDSLSSLSRAGENGKLTWKIYEDFFIKTGKVQIEDLNNYKKNHLPILQLLSSDDQKEFFRIYTKYSTTMFCDIFLEEPEENLFPPTQDVLVDWLLEMTEGEHAANLFVATHSPYIVTAFIERPNLDISLFVTKTLRSNGNIIKTATEEEIQGVYDNGIDVFFNNNYFE